MTNSKAAKSTKSTAKLGSFGGHRGIKCEHCGTVFFHGAVCGCEASKRAAYGDAYQAPKFDGYATLTF